MDLTVSKRYRVIPAFVVFLALLLVALGPIQAQTPTSSADVVATAEAAVVEARGLARETNLTLATAQAALATLEAGLVTPEPTATATMVPTETQAPTSTPRPTATTMPTATIPSSTATATPRSIRGNTSTATAVPRPTERPTLVPTSEPPSVTPETALQTYKMLVVIPSVYIVEGQTLRVPIAEIQAAREAANNIPVWVRDLSSGMGDVAVTVVVDNYPVSTFRQWCSGTVCGNWVGPTDIQRAITEQGGASQYDFVASFVPDNIDGVEIMSCPCGGLAIYRYMTVQMYGKNIYQTTTIHEFAHDLIDFNLVRQGYEDVPSCNYDWTVVHCGYVYGGAHWGWFRGLLSGTLDPARTGGRGLTTEAYRDFDPPTELQSNVSRDSVGEDFPWTGREQPVAGHTDPEDPAMLEGIQPDGTFCHEGICS